MLTPSELELLQLKQFEISFVSTATAVFSEAIKAYRIWQQWEAINSLLAPEASDAAILRSSLVHSRMHLPLDDIRRVLARDAILRMFSISEHPTARNGSPRRRSLAQLAEDLRDPRIRRWLASECRFSGSPWTDTDASRLALVVSSHIEHFMTTFGRANTEGTSQTAYSDLRKSLAMTRNAIADSVPIAPTDLAQVDQIRAFMEQTLEFCADIMVVAEGRDVPFEQLKIEGREQSRRFWSTALASVCGQPPDMNAKQKT